ncbi:MAG: hypothetical protein A2289_00675 [Deltaproteobacteria bacterium RIFOXYA12_FULL_58_15]|nr:MAG: hypothetical protein A2289_00675 [Deltaproteobacteria bacterium RIFOXYA12_FULL_58_15]OGR08534.1 MAG: hypothetical protein A2341_25310 [Deltaproteobacteria bacterium RIFOXYB12_FULL_58_9]
MDHSTTRHWVPNYCHTDNFLPTVQETVILMANPPYFFPDFVGRAMAFLQSEAVAKLGFVFDPTSVLPCKWKCSDESLFGVDLALYAFTGQHPFDKGKLGGQFNEGAVAAGVHHCKTNIDFGGAHVGYIPGPNGGEFGHIQRPLNAEELSTDCGALMGIMRPYKEIYDDACRSILIYRPAGERILTSIPNEFLEPSWSSHNIKLLIDVERFCDGLVPYDVNIRHTHKLAGRSLFYVNDEFLLSVSSENLGRYSTPEKHRIGPELTSPFFHIFDVNPEMEGGVLRHRFLAYMKYILSSKVAPYPLKAAVTRSNIEYNKLTDCVRAEAFRHYSFASFTGVFIDMYDVAKRSYVNLFQPIGCSLKTADRIREHEFSAAELREAFDGLSPAKPVIPLKGVLGYDNADHLIADFTFRPENPTTPTLGQSRRG